MDDTAQVGSERRNALRYRAFRLAFCGTPQVQLRASEVMSPVFAAGQGELTPDLLDAALDRLINHIDEL